MNKLWNGKHFECSAGEPCWKCEIEEQSGRSPWYSPAALLAVLPSAYEEEPQ
jgi:hypothetical protein